MSGRDRFHDLAALVVSGAATAGEQRELEALVAGDPDAAAELAAYRDAAALLGAGLDEIEPPAGVRDRVLEAAAAAAGDDRADVIGLASRRRRRTALAAALAGVAAAAAVVLAILWSREQARVERLEERLAEIERRAADQVADQRERADLLAAELAEARRRTAFVDSPSLRMATLGTDAGPTVKILIDEAGERWLVLAYDMPPAEPGKDYQLWAIPRAEGAAPVPIGLLRPGRGGALEAEIELPIDIESIKAAAISLEQAGGAHAPTDVKMLGPI